MKSDNNALLKYCVNPLHWLMIGIISLISLFVQMPRFCHKPLIIMLAFFIKRLSRLRSKAITINLKMCFPTLSEKARQKIMDSVIKSIVNTLFDTAYCYYNRLFKKIPVEIEGLEYLQTAIKNHQAIILLTAHFNTTFIAGKFIHDCLNQKIANVFKEQSHPLINYLYERKQYQYFLPIRKNNIRQMLRALKEKYPVIYLFDLNDTLGNTFIPFFNIPAATNTALCKIAQVSHATVIPYVCLKKVDKKYHLQFMKPLEKFPGEDAVADLTHVSLIFEEIIKQYPEQYLWTHRRFKTRPAGENKIY